MKYGHCFLLCMKTILLLHWPAKSQALWAGPVGEGPSPAVMPTPHTFAGQHPSTQLPVVPMPAHRAQLTPCPWDRREHVEFHTVRSVCFLMGCRDQGASFILRSFSLFQWFKSTALPLWWGSPYPSDKVNLNTILRQSSCHVCPCLQTREGLPHTSEPRNSDRSTYVRRVNNLKLSSFHIRT